MELSTATEIAEMEAALKSVQARDSSRDIRREEFPLPILGPVLERLCGQVLDGRGFVLLRGVPVEDRPIEESAAAYSGIGTDSAAPVAERQGTSARPIYDLGGNSMTDPNIRSYATSERQNFHIDRCDVVALLCLRRASRAGCRRSPARWRCKTSCWHAVPISGAPVSAVPGRSARRSAGRKAPFYEAPVFNE